MDFARKQLEKYGWSDGKGLGKNENGISQALKPKLKRSVAGVGYDAATDFTEHWWSALYDKAAKNVEVEEKNGKTKKIKTKDSDEFEITNSTWKIHKKKKEDDGPVDQYADFFVRTDILTGGKVKSKKVKKESDCDEEPRDSMKLSDEDLFAACEGRTAHKGARHGLKALGKLARIEQQEQMLLKQARFKGYSLAKTFDSNEDTQIFEESNLNTDCDTNVVSKKKQKKKRCYSFTRNMDVNDADKTGDSTDNTNRKKEKKNKHSSKSEIKLQEDSSTENNIDKQGSFNSKNETNINEENMYDTEEVQENKVRKKKRKTVESDGSDSGEKKKK